MTADGGPEQRWLYLANARIPSEKAHVYQILQMCDALQLEGACVGLVSPRRANIDLMRAVGDVSRYYGLMFRPHWQQLFTLDFVRLVTLDYPWLGRIGLAVAAHQLQTLSFAAAAALHALRQHRPATVWYSRDWPVLLACVAIAARGQRPKPGRAASMATWPRRDASTLTDTAPGPHIAPRLRPLLVWEAHDFPTGMAAGRALCLLLDRLDGVVAISHGLGERVLAAGFPADRMLIAPDAVDPQRFQRPRARSEARRSLGLPEDGKIVGYAGHLYPWKGVYTLADASAELPDGTRVLIVGGTEPDVRALRDHVQRRGLSSVVLVGHVPPACIPEYLAAADVLVLPNSAQEEISRRYTSPLKLFEYAASRRPIVAAAVPALKELLRHRDSAWLVQPDSPSHLAAGLRVVLADEALAARLIDGASRALGAYTWRARARQLLDFAAALNPR